MVSSISSALARCTSRITARRIIGPREVTIIMRGCRKITRIHFIMLYSRNFEETIIILNGGNRYRIEFDLSRLNENSVRCFGNIYINPEDPIEFTYFTVNNEIGGYTPMNAAREFIGDI